MIRISSTAAFILALSAGWAMAQDAPQETTPAEPGTEQATAEPGAPAEPDAPAEPPTRPGDEESTLPVSDGVAECAAMLAVASSKSKNFVERDRMREASAAWFAASGDLAGQEGTEIADGLWEEKVQEWAGKIGSVDGMRGMEDWTAYCIHVGTSNGLDPAQFEGS